MNAEVLAGASAVFLSLVFAYVPKLKDWFNTKEGTVKRLIMAIALLFVALGSFGLSCWQPERFVDVVVCSDAGLLDLAWLYIVALVANQGSYSLAVK